MLWDANQYLKGINLWSKRQFFPEPITVLFIKKRGQKKNNDGNSRPGVITKEKNIILPVYKYKLPAWSQGVLQLAFKAKHLSQLTTQLMVATKFGDIQWPTKGPWLVNLLIFTIVKSETRKKAEDHYKKLNILGIWFKKNNLLHNNINPKRQPTLTKVRVGGFTWPTFSGDCRKPDSSMQLEGVIAGLSEKSEPAALI